MALGGGVFTTQNKILAGSYINFVSVERAGSNLGERGIVALPISLNWGADDIVFKVTDRQFLTKCEEIFGYDISSDEMQNLREVFKYAKTVYFYRLNGSDGVKADCTYATALYSGTRGNDIKIVIKKNVDDTSKYDVKTFVDTLEVDTQTVASATDLKDNKFVKFKTSASLVETAGTPLENGTNGTVAGAQWTKALDALEAYFFNVLICNSTETTIKAMCVAYTKRMRENVGAKFQLVVHKYNTADYEGVISVENNLVGESSASAKLVYWVGGVEADCAVNKSVTNRVYDGELDVDVEYTQTDLEDCMLEGKFVLHQVGDDVRVLEDINSLTTFTNTKGEDFKYNQTIRVIDQIANDIAKLFNTNYIGIIPNDNAGRISLWNDIVKHHQELQRLRAIEGFEPKDITVDQGDSKKAVVVNDHITVVNAMAQLYMTVVVA